MGRQFNLSKEDTDHVVKNGNLKERIYIRNGKTVTMVNIQGKWVEKPQDNDSNT